MKRLLLAGLFLGSLAHAVDLVDVTSTPSTRQTFNQSYRGIGDGTNAATSDGVTANSFTNVVTSTTVKGSGGWLHLMTTWGTCASQVIVADSASSAYSVVIATIPANQSSQTYWFDARFTNGLWLGVPAACTHQIFVSYR